MLDNYLNCHEKQNKETNKERSSKELKEINKYNGKGLKNK